MGGGEGSVCFVFFCFKSFIFLSFVVLPMNQHQTGIFSFNKAFFALKLPNDIAHITVLLCSCPAVKSEDMWMEAQPVEGLHSFAQILRANKQSADSATIRTAGELREPSGYPGIESHELSAVDLTTRQDSLTLLPLLLNSSSSSSDNLKILFLLVCLFLEELTFLAKNKEKLL